MIHVMKPTPNPYGDTTGVSVDGRTYFADADGLFRVHDEVAVALALSGWETVSVESPGEEPARAPSDAPETPKATRAQTDYHDAPKRRTRVAKAGEQK